MKHLDGSCKRIKYKDAGELQSATSRLLFFLGGLLKRDRPLNGRLGGLHGLLVIEQLGARMDFRHDLIVRKLRQGAYIMSADTRYASFTFELRLHPPQIKLRISTVLKATTYTEQHRAKA